MGNEVGKSSSRMGISAMAAVTRIEKNEILLLQKKFREHSQRAGSADLITRADFDEILQSVADIIESSDAELLDRLFTMFDTSGDSQIDFRDFTVGIAPLTTGTVLDKLRFAFQCYDFNNAGTLSSGDVRRIFTAINNVASYFGDPVVTPEQIEELVTDVFKKGSNPTLPLKYQDYLTFISEHPVVVTFVSGRGTERFGR